MSLTTVFAIDWAYRLIPWLASNTIIRLIQVMKEANTLMIEYRKKEKRTDRLWLNWTLDTIRDKTKKPELRDYNSINGTYYMDVLIQLMNKLRLG